MKSRYFPYTQREQNMLKQVRNFVDLRVYMHIKEKADFESGRLEHPSALRLTTGTIAREISLPAIQGAPALEFSIFAVIRSLERLEALGLIDEVDRSGRFLRLRLPMAAANTCESNTEQKKSASNSTENRAKSARKSASYKRSETVAAQGVQDTHTGKSARKSASNCTENGEKSASIENDESSETVVGQGFSGDNIVSLNMKKQSVLNSLPQTPSGEETPSPSATQNQPHTPSDDGLQETKEEKAVNRIRDIVADEADGMIDFVDTKKSRGFYKRWYLLNISEDRIRSAVREVIATASMAAIVDSVDTVVRGVVLVPVPAAAKKDPNKGRLQL